MTVHNIQKGLKQGRTLCCNVGEEGRGPCDMCSMDHTEGSEGGNNQGRTQCCDVSLGKGGRGGDSMYVSYSTECSEGVRSRAEPSTVMLA